VVAERRQQVVEAERRWAAAVCVAVAAEQQLVAAVVVCVAAER
jgi:hypothetical protein